MKRIIIFAAALFQLAAPLTGSAQKVLHDSIVTGLKKGVKGFMERYHAPGIAIVIVHGNDIIFSDAAGYANLEKKIPVTIHSRYSIQSLTKVFTATMFMQLVQQKVVSLNHEVKKLVPELNDHRPNGRGEGITLLQLATHTSGLPRNSPADIQFTKQIDRWLGGGQNNQPIQAASRQEFLRALQHIQKGNPEYELLGYGDRRYSNWGYSLLGLALERAANVKYADYIVSRICQPLGMNNTLFTGRAAKAEDAVKGYYYVDSTGTFTGVPEFRPNSAQPAGGLYSSAADLARFISFQFSGGKADVLSGKNRAMMRAFGIGWKQSFPFVTHEGAMLGYRCEIVLDPAAKVGWAILTNTTDFDFSRMNQYISQLVLPAFSRKPAPGPDQFAGTYHLSGDFDSLRIFLKDGQLYSTYLADELPVLPLTPAGPNRFKASTRTMYTIGYEFITGENGEIEAVNMGQLKWYKQ